MPNISKRVAYAYESPIRKLAPYAYAAQEAGKKVFYMNIGQPDILTPPSSIQKVQNTPIDIIKYAPSQGIASYREKLVGYYKKFGVEVTKEDILVTNGASEAISFLLYTCLDVGEEVIMAEPLYANYLGFAELAGIGVKPVTSTIETGFALPNIEEFEKAITKRTKAILICNPNNPTGAVYSEEVLRAIAALAKKYDLYLFVDEVYSEFCYDGSVFFSVLNIKDLEDNIAIVDSVSKRFSACGARVGTIVTRNKAMFTALMKYAQFRLSAPTMGQMLAEAFLDLGDDYIDEVRSEYDKRRNVLYERLSAMDGVKCYKPGGAFYVFAELPIDDSDRFCQWLLEKFSYQNQTVMLAPGAGFYASSKLGKREVRFAYVLNTDAINTAMDCLEKALEEYPYANKQNVL